MIDCMVEHLTKKSVKNVYVQKGCIKTLEPNDLRENLSFSMLSKTNFENAFGKNMKHRQKKNSSARMK